jgi:4-hydroxybenzoate polyprenyltransferase
MVLKSVLYNSVTVSLPKNAVQFLLGVVLFWLVFGAFDFLTASLALAAFIIGYSSVYFFNDITDCEEDRDDSEKREWKLVANGKIGKRGAGAIGFLLLVSGIALASAVNGWFLMIMVLLISLNFLHSSPYVRMKKRMAGAAVNITTIEFLKYSSGWFALTSNLTAFPFWLILTFSLIYTVVYLVYKFRFKGKEIKLNKSVIVPLGVASAFSYLVSIALYNFALPMILLLAMSIALAKFSIGKRLKFMNWLWVEFTILPMIVIAFLLLSIPTIAQANNNITSTIDHYKEDIYQELPEGVADRLRNLSEPSYASLEEFQDAVNQSLNISSLTIFESANNK